jgi:hypothetical protein
MPEIYCYERTICGADYVQGLVVGVIASIDGVAKFALN